MQHIQTYKSTILKENEIPKNQQKARLKKKKKKGRI